jgi:hypothetical protein
MKARPGFWLGFGAGVATTFVLGIAVIIAVAVLWTGPPLVVTATAPDTAVVGEEFTVSMEVFNPHAESVELDNIEASSQMLELFEVTAVYPEGTRSDFFGIGVWYLDKVIVPSAQQLVTVSMRARRPGLGLIELRLCNAYEDCSPVVHPIDVISR